MASRGEMNDKVNFMFSHGKSHLLIFDRFPITMKHFDCIVFSYIHTFNGIKLKREAAEILIKTRKGKWKTIILAGACDFL